MNSNMPFKFALLFLVAISVLTCNPENKDEKNYIFLGHPYDWQDWYGIDPRLEKLDFDQFDQVWLGGDVCSRTTDKAATLNYLDSIFHLSSDKLQWTLGNHDVKYGNVQYITDKTRRNSFYTQTFDDICLLVLNTNLFWYFSPRTLIKDDCEDRQRQLDFMKSVTDTVKNVSHLVILHHHALMSELRKDSTGEVPQVFNTNYEAIQASCDSAVYLTEFLYPKLQEVQKRGVEVVLIGGDFGMRAKEYEFVTQEGITFLGSGINNSLEFETAPDYVTSFDKDKILLIKKNMGEQQLDWKFVELDALVEEHLKK